MATKKEKIKLEQEIRKKELYNYQKEIEQDPVLSEIESIKAEIKETELARKSKIWERQSDKLKREQSLARERNKFRNYEQRYGAFKKPKAPNPKQQKQEIDTSVINQVASDQLKFMESLTDLHYIKDKNFFNTALEIFRKRYINVRYKHNPDTGEITRNVGTRDQKTQESKDWFKKKISGLINQHIKKNDNGFLYTEILNNKAATAQSTVKMGNVYFFGYNPKHWKDLKMYDLFPLVLVLGISGNLMYGLNLHYLPRKQRMDVLKKCLGLRGDTGYNSKVVDDIENYLNESFELMDTDIDKFDAHFKMVDTFNDMVEEYNQASTAEEQEIILEKIKKNAEEQGYGTGKESGNFVIRTYSENLNDMLKKIKLDIKDKRELFMKDLNSLKSDKRIKPNEVDGSSYPNLFKRYILDEGRIANGRFIHIPLEEYRFVVDLPGYWMETDMKKPRNVRTAIHTTRRYQY